MKKNIITISAILAVLVCVIGGWVIYKMRTADNSINSSKSLAKVYDSYKNDKNPQKAREAIEYVSKTNMLEGNPKITPLLLGFYSGLFHENPELIGEFEKINLSSKSKDLIKDAAAFEAIMEKIFADKGNSAQSPAFIDVMWGYYSATSDIRAVKKIIAVQKTTQIPAIKNAAKISLDSAAKTDKEVAKLWK